MKLVLAGSTGFVATEVIRQAIGNPAIASIVALTRREVAAPPDSGADATKLKSVICNDFSNYSDEVKKDLAGADACIWYGTSKPSLNWINADVPKASRGHTFQSKGNAI